MSLPQSLKQDETIGIFSSSSPTTEQAIKKMKIYFEAKGFSVKIAQNTLAKYGFMAGSPQMRADDFNELLSDKAVRMIMTATGGKSASHLLPLINYEAFSVDPKIIVGLSDPSILLNAITAKTNIPTFHGPNGYSFGHTEPTAFSEENFWPVVTNTIKIPYQFPVSEYFQVLKGESVIEGRLFGGHLGTIRTLIGTPWMPNLRGAILFIEEIFVELHQIDAMLSHLRLAGVFDKINGLIMGQVVECHEKSYDQIETLEDIILRNCADYDFPIINNIPLGHTDDKITLPIGIRVKIDPQTNSFTLLESPLR